MSHHKMKPLTKYILFERGDQVKCTLLHRSDPALQIVTDDHKFQEP